MGDRRSGSCSRNSAPRGARWRASSVPPMPVGQRFAQAQAQAEAALRVVKKGSNRRGSTSGAMPGPLSAR